jgi:hypothetical protein
MFTDKNANRSVTVNLCSSDEHTHHTNGNDEARLASPVWLHPVQDAAGQPWRIRTLTFVHTMAPPGMAPGIIKITPHRGEPEVPHGTHVRDWTGLDPQALRANHTAWVHATTRPVH